MAIDFSGTAQNYFATTTPVTSVPLTLACWFNPDSASDFGVLLGSLDSAAGTWRGFYIAAHGGQPNDPVYAITAENSNFVSAYSSTGYSVGTWHHACGVFRAANDRSAYIDGTSRGNDNGNQTPTGVDCLGIGASRRSITDNFFNGRIAEAAIWAAALDDSEVLSLGRGVSPLKVRPQSLVLYCPLIRGPQDLKGRSISTNGSPTVAAHPRIYY